MSSLLDSGAIKGIAFDLEGTIIDLEELHFAAFVESVSGFGHTTSFDEIVDNIPLAIGGGDKIIAEGLIRLYQLPISSDDLLARKRQRYEQSLAETEILPRAGFVAFLRKVQERGIPTMIGSLTPRESGEHLIRRSGLDTYFPSVTRVFLEDVQQKKPAPDVYLKTAGLMGIEPHQQLVFEDSVPGVMAALGVGSEVIALPVFTMPENIAKLKLAGATQIFDSWDLIF